MRETFRNLKPVIKISASIGLLAFSVLLISYYTLFPSKGNFHSDCTDTLMWASASYDAMSIFNSDFSYACLLPFGTSLIMTLLIPITGVTMTTHVIGMFCFFILFTAAFLFMLKQMHWGLGWSSVATFVLLLFCSGSAKLREIFWGHTIYYSLGVFFIFVGLGLLFHLMNLTEAPERNKKIRLHSILCTVLIFIWFVLTGTDQTIAITIFALPVMAGFFCERWLDRTTEIKSKKNLLALILLFIMGTGTGAGYLLTNHLAGDITAGYQESYSEYSDMSTWASHLEGFPTAWISLLGAAMKEDDPLFSVNSIKSLLIVIAAILLLVLPIAALCCYPKIQDAKLRILILTHWFMSLLIMMGYVMGRLYIANWRLSPIVATSVVVSVAFVRWAVSQVQLQRIAVLCMIPILLVSTMHAVTVAGMPMNNTSENTLYQLSEQLEDLNLTYGYASFWQANGLTIVSDSHIQCRDVWIDENGCRIRNYQSNSHWYEDQPEQENYFLLMTSTEAQYLIHRNDALYTKPHDTANLQKGYVVWIYSENLF